SCLGIAHLLDHKRRAEDEEAEETTDDEAIIEADPVQAEISSDEQGTSTEFNFEEDRTLVEKLFDVDYTCGSTGTKLSCRRVHIHGGSTTSSHQTPLEDKSTIIIRIQSSFFFGCYSVSKHSKVSAMPWHAGGIGMPFPPAKWHAGMPPHDFLMPPSLLRTHCT